jgi:hypothetical protein
VSHRGLDGRIDSAVGGNQQGTAVPAEILHSPGNFQQAPRISQDDEHRIAGVVEEILPAIQRSELKIEENPAKNMRSRAKIGGRRRALGSGRRYEKTQPDQDDEPSRPEEERGLASRAFHAAGTSAR